MYTKKRFFILLSLVLALLLAFNIYAFLEQKTAKQSIQADDAHAKDLQRVEVVVSEIKKYYVKPVAEKTLFDNAISGMLFSLDPHSEYLKKDELEDLATITLGKFGGIGVEVIPDQGALRVISPLDDTPAFKAGIKAGDIIVQIDGKLVKNMTLRNAINLMRGPEGSKLALTILRKNQLKPITFTLTRNIIKVDTIKSRMLEPGYGYVRIAFFQEPTENDLLRAVAKLKKQTADGGLKGLVLDLRNNPGGLFDAAVKVADNFLDSTKLKNNVIVYTRGNDLNSQIIARATPGELLPNVPLIVLLNEGSASASEIVAGALQDCKRAIIVGTKSFGKGSVQTLLPVDNESAIKLTTALYYTPSGKSIQAKGIEPDVVISDIKIPEKNKAAELNGVRLSEADLIDHIEAAEEKNKDVDPKSLTLNQLTADEKSDQAKKDLLYKDYQLYEALTMLKAINAMHK